MPASSREDFVERQERLYREAYSMVCIHLGEQALRQLYDMRVPPATFPVGIWVWLYRQTAVVSRPLPKMAAELFRAISGDEGVGLLDVVVQRMSRTKPQVFHIDKLTLWTPNYFLPNFCR